MRKIFVRISAVFILLLLGAPAFGGVGLKTVESSRSVQETVARIESIVKGKGMRIFAVIDHGEGARKIGATLRPTEVVIFGNPKVGTPLMRCSPTIGIDLPQKALVWEDEKGHVWITYNDPRYLSYRHGTGECNGVMGKVARALERIIGDAAKP